MSVMVRRAVAADAHEIAVIHVRAWQAAYCGLMPSEFLASLSVEQRTAFWVEVLCDPASAVWVAEEAGCVRGWISVGPCRDEDTGLSTAELYALYIHPDSWRCGLGGALWKEAETHLRVALFGQVTLWVVAENARARAFYERMGFRDDGGRKGCERGGEDLLEIRMRREL